MATSHCTSEAVFASLLQRFGLDGLKPKFDEKSWKTISSFAVTCGFNTDDINDDALKRVVVRHVCAWDGEGSEPMLTNNIRQLFIHATQAHLADLRAEFDPRGTDAPVKLHKHDRKMRRQLLRASLKDAFPEIEDPDFDWAWGPEDEVYNMLREDELGDYMGPECFPTRREEKKWLQKNKKGRNMAAATALWKTLSGHEVEEEKKLLVPEVKREMHLINHAFRRRGLTLHSTGVMSYAKHETWRRRLFVAMNQEVTFADEAPPGIPDILKADEKIWDLLRDKIDGLMIKGGQLPLDKEIDTILQHGEVDRILMVRPRSQRALATDVQPERPASGKVARTATDAKDGDAKLKNRLDNQERHITNLKKQLAQASGGQAGAAKPPKGKGKGKEKKGKGKGKKGNEKKRKFVPMPKPLQGCDPETTDGQPVCYDCNMWKGCKKAKWGETCDKGLHVCIKCGEHHSYVNCPNK